MVLKQSDKWAANMKIAGTLPFVVVIVIAVSGLLGYVPGLRLLGSLNKEYIPMAPSTAVFFIILSIAFLLNRREVNRSTGLFSIIFSFVVSVFGFVKLIEYYFGRTSSFEEILIGETAKLGSIPIGIMSPSTGALFFIAGVATLIYVAERTIGSDKVFSGHTFGLLACSVSASAFTFILAYVYGDPFLYDKGRTVPMAITTAIAFLFLSMGQLAVANRECFPLVFFTGNNTPARLVRVFLPLLMGALLLFDTLRHYYLPVTAGPLVLAVFFISFSVIVCLVAMRTGRNVGSSIDAAEEALRESEEKYRLMMKSVTDPVYICSPELTVEYMNPAMIKRLGRDAAGEACYSALHGLDQKCDWCVFDEVTRGKIIETNIVSPLDNRTYRVTNMPIHHEDGLISKMTFYRDITDYLKAISEKEKAHTQLLQAQKMESIGSLAGGTAHDFNNILTTIIGNTELALNDVPESNPARECLEEIQTASLRAKDVVRQLLGFARKSVFQLMPVQISPIISETLKLIRASTPTTIESRQNLSFESDTVMADSTQISQVLINLCTNAKNAMEKDGGVLEVKLENTSLDENSATRYEDLSPGNYLKLTVKDCGYGIDPKNIDRIFDPYFTTNNLAESTGMGLAVVHGIVKHHNGAITVASELGKGTVFEVLFPLTEAKAEQEAREPKALPTGNEKILFVDDEASLVKMVKRSLEIQGYQVETKSDPVEALKLVRSDPDRFDLIITDMTMPNMTGDKLAKEILRIRPEMPIILCSGFSEKIDAEKARALGIRKYIEKPLDMSDFVVSIRKVLDAGRSKS